MKGNTGAGARVSMSRRVGDIQGRDKRSVVGQLKVSDRETDHRK